MADDDFYKQNTLHDLPKDQPTSLPIEIPSQIGAYTIESLLETGGMSQVYLATHPETKEPVTLKVLLPKFVGNQEVVQRFLNEAEIISLADHPNIVTLYGHGKWEGGVFIAMEFIQGVSLRQYLQRHPLTLKRALEIVLEIAYALCHLHTHGIIHRDLKLENILITESGAIKVIDFGIAQVLTESKEPTNAISRPRIIGTPIYMSPEQRDNPEAVSYPSDIYSLGLISYELVLGKLSHGHVHLSLMPKGMQKILTKALQPRPEDRYQDVVDFIADISSYLNSKTLHAEKKSIDLITEVAENLMLAQSNILPKSVPLWRIIELGAVHNKGSRYSGIYYDFFALENGTYCIVLGECASKGPEGIVYAANLRGLVRSLVRSNPAPRDFIRELNDHLCHDPIDQLFSLNYLLLDPKQNLMHTICCGMENIWVVPHNTKNIVHLSCSNLAVGIEPSTEFNIKTQSWVPGDAILLNNFHFGMSHSTIHYDKEEFFAKIFSDHLHLAPQKQMETVLRKIKALAGKQIDEQSLVLINILRHE